MIMSGYFQRVSYKRLLIHFISPKKGVSPGLSFCKCIVEEHSGTINVSSEEGIGTTIFIRIPIVPSDTRYIDVETTLLNNEQFTI